jgi:para-aminobenzoate synthetase/4-amino-4-deoxychorismate lyase
MIPSARHYFLDREELAVGDCVIRWVHSELGPGWLYFSAPVRLVGAASIDAVIPALAEVEAAAADGAYAVGFLSYEAASAFDSSLPSPKGGSLPLIWFAVYDGPPSFARELLPCYEEPLGLRLSREWELGDYARRFEQVKEAMSRGESYQVNLTSRLAVESSDSMFGLFRRVCGTQPPPYAGYVHGEGWEIASFSPELFLEKTGQTVAMSPMKGTRKSGTHDLPEMASDPKSLAENLMIVDMVRNDLGKVARVGSIRASRLFALESHRTVQQMTSRIEAESSAGLTELMAAVFPPASVTGAPKIAACALIDRLESSPREVYCGAIGIVRPNGDARFSVAIRTAWKSDAAGPVRYGIGSGVVWDSDLHEEFDECLLKAAVLTQPALQWELVECFHRDALTDEARLEDHWLRVSRSAEVLGIPLDQARFEALLKPLRSRADLPNKIRIAIRRDGAMSLSVSNSAVSGQSLNGALARRPISSKDPNLAHKTNSRQVFDDALDGRPGFDEVLLFNERNEVAEFCRGNAVFRIDDTLVTPPPSSGCLPGIGAKRFVAQGLAKYDVVTLDQARQSTETYFVNSIRGMVPVEMDWGE